MIVGERPDEWPHIERYSDTPLFQSKAVAQQTGIATTTLYAWERRYAILSPRRADNDYRLYSERDIMTIRWLKERIDEGMSISQAVALFRHRSEEQQRMQEEPPPQAIPAFHIALPEMTAGERVTAEGEQEEGEKRPADENWLPIGREPGPDSERVYDMQTVQRNLLMAFTSLDESSARVLMAAMLAIYPVEQVCMELIVPTLWQIGQLWHEGKISVSVEHFASAFVRGLLSNLLHTASEPVDAPLAITCCAPGEPHEVAPLMLALFLRRAGVRVAYLGQSIESDGLLQTIQQQLPALLCISLTLHRYADGLIDLGRRVEALPAPRPLFAFGGQVFVHYTHLIAQVPGVYLNGDLRASVSQLRRLLAARSKS